MLRRTEIGLLIGFAIAVALATVFGILNTPSGDLLDSRRSINVYGPEGTAGLGHALERLGFRVEQRRRALFDLAIDTAQVDSSELLVLIDLSSMVSRTESLGLRRYVERGGSLFIGAESSVAVCFGWATRFLTPDDEEQDSVPLQLEPGIGPVPASDARWAPLGPDTVAVDEEKEVVFWEKPSEEYEGCSIEPTRVDTLLRAENGEPVALQLRFEGGGRVTMLADSRYLTNQVLRDSDAGAVVLPLLLAGDPSRVIFDEYHHGFGTSSSIWLVAGRWLSGNPAGWAVLQLAFAGLLALAFVAVRFGPATSIIRRERRSGLEHLDALAVGFERARARRTAMTLIANGLRRRLARTGSGLSSQSDIAGWLGSLSLATQSAEARAEVERLGQLALSGDSDEAVLETAKTVERVWEALGK